MNTKHLMIASTLVLAILGITALFFPDEALQLIGGQSGNASMLIVQLSGALYIGFAALNWTAKNVLVGGIYAKPVSLGNFAHFFIGALTLIKVVAFGGASIAIWWVLTGLYILFAAAFAWVSFTSPKLKKESGK